MLVFVSANLGLWLSNRIVRYTVKGHGAAFALIYGVDFFAFLGFALLGLLTAWLLAFRPETFKRAIERSIAKRNSN
jgi:ABC-type sulfate transport system permease component